jgi:hypothetical protein
MSIFDDIADDVGDSLRDGRNSASDALSDGFGDLSDGFTGVFHQMSDGLSSVWRGFEDGLTDLSEFLGNALNEIGAGLSQLWNYLGEVFDEWVRKIMDIVRGLLKNLGEMLYFLVDLIVSFFKDILSMDWKTYFIIGAAVVSAVLLYKVTTQGISKVVGSDEPSQTRVPASNDEPEIHINQAV